MSTKLVVEADLNEIIEEITDVGLSDVALSRAELSALIVRFYGAVINAVQYKAITPEKANNLHIWLAGQLEL
jgi:hypothetical protein